MVFPTQFAIWLFNAILAISFTPTLLQPSNVELLKLVTSFNQKVENKNLDNFNGIQPIEEEGTDGQKIFNFMASVSNKYHQFFLGFEEFVNGASILCSKDEEFAQKWKAHKWDVLAEQSKECISELTEPKEIATFLKLLKDKVTPLQYAIQLEIDIFAGKTNIKEQTDILSKNRRAIVNESKLVQEWIKLKSSNMDDHLNSKYNELVKSVRKIEQIVKNKLGSEMMDKKSVKTLKEHFKQRKIHLEKVEFGNAETRELIEQLKGQQIEMPNEVEKIQDYFTLREKVNHSLIDKIQAELNGIIKEQFSGNDGNPSTSETNMMATNQIKKRLLSSFLAFLKKALIENELFFKFLTMKFVELYDKEKDINKKEIIVEEYKYNYDYLLFVEWSKRFKHLIEQHIERSIRNGTDESTIQSELGEMVIIRNLMGEKIKILHLPQSDKIHEAVAMLQWIYNEYLGKYGKQSSAANQLLGGAKLRQEIADALQKESIHAHQTSEYFGELMFDEWPKMKKLIPAATGAAKTNESQGRGVNILKFLKKKPDQLERD